MSRTTRYKNFWYHSILEEVKRYPDLLKEENSLLSWQYYHAIERTIEEMPELWPKDYAERIRALNMMFFEEHKGYDETAMKLYVSRRTLVGWVSDFVNRVGIQAGRKSLRKKNHKR